MDAMRRSMVVILAELTREHPNIKAVTLPEVNHTSVIREHAGVVADEIRTFLREVGTAA